MTTIGPMPGATGIISQQENIGGSGGLVTWAVNLAVDAVMEAIAAGYEPEPSVARTLAHARVNKARDIGTLVHKQVETVLTGGQPEPTADTAPYIYSYSSFLADHRPIFHKVEQGVISVKHRYGGTPDGIATLATFGRRPGVFEVKSGKAKPTHRLQIAAYEASDGFGGTIDGYHRYWYTEGDPIEPLPRLGTGWLLYLRPDGYELVPVNVTAADRRHFLYLAGAYHRLRDWQASLNGKDKP